MQKQYPITGDPTCSFRSGRGNAGQNYGFRGNQLLKLVGPGQRSGGGWGDVGELPDEKKRLEPGHDCRR